MRIVISNIEYRSLIIDDVTPKMRDFQSRLWALFHYPQRWFGNARVLKYDLLYPTNVVSRIGVVGTVAQRVFSPVNLYLFLSSDFWFWLCSISPRVIVCFAAILKSPLFIIFAKWCLSKQSSKQYRLPHQQTWQWQYEGGGLQFSFVWFNLSYVDGSRDAWFDL